MDSPIIIVLASGRGERFRDSGGTCDKLQASLVHRTVLQHTLAAVRASGLPWHLEDRGLPGMGDSVAAAVAATSQSRGWLILPADLPLVQSKTLLAVAGALRQHAVVIPCYQGRRGHPVGFGADCRGALLELRGDVGAAAVARLHGPFQLRVNDIGCVTDVDTVDDLQLVQWLMRTLAPSVAHGGGSIRQDPEPLRF